MASVGVLPSVPTVSDVGFAPTAGVYPGVWASAQSCPMGTLVFLEL